MRALGQAADERPEGARVGRVDADLASGRRPGRVGRQDEQAALALLFEQRRQRVAGAALVGEEQPGARLGGRRGGRGLVERGPAAPLERVQPGLGAARRPGRLGRLDPEALDLGQHGAGLVEQQQVADQASRAALDDPGVRPEPAGRAAVEAQRSMPTGR